MKLLAQVAQELRARFGRGGCPVVIGAVSPIIAGRRDGAVQGPLDAGMPALRGAGACAPRPAAPVELVNDAAVLGSVPRFCAFVEVFYGNVNPPPFWIDPVPDPRHQQDPDHARLLAYPVVPPADCIIPPNLRPCCGQPMRELACCPNAIIVGVDRIWTVHPVRRHVKAPQPCRAGQVVGHQVYRHEGTDARACPEIDALLPVIIKCASPGTMLKSRSRGCPGTAESYGERRHLRCRRDGKSRQQQEGC